MKTLREEWSGASHNASDSIPRRSSSPPANAVLLRGYLEAVPGIGSCQVLLKPDWLFLSPENHSFRTLC